MQMQKMMTYNITELLTIFQTFSRVLCVELTASRHTEKWSSARNLTRRIAAKHKTSQTASLLQPLRTDRHT